MAQQNQNQQDLREILQIRRDKLAALQEAGMNPFEITRYDVTHHAQEVKDQFDQLEGQTVSLAGRLMSKRGMGKVSMHRHSPEMWSRWTRMSRKPCGLHTGTLLLMEVPVQGHALQALHVQSHGAPVLWTASSLLRSRTGNCSGAYSVWKSRTRQGHPPSAPRKAAQV